MKYNISDWLTQVLTQGELEVLVHLKENTNKDTFSHILCISDFLLVNKMNFLKMYFNINLS